MVAEEKEAGHLGLSVGRSSPISRIPRGFFSVGMVATTDLALTLACGVIALILLLPNRQGLITRGRGYLLLILYFGFVWASLQT